MSVVNVWEIFSGRSGDWNLDKTTRKYTRVFRVTTSDDADEPIAIFNGVGIPLMADPYPLDSNVLVINKSAKQDNDNPRVWDVTVEYSSVLPDPDKQQENPIARPAIYKVNFEHTKAAITEDFDSKKIVNSAGQPFLPVLEKDDHRVKITCDINRLFTIDDDTNEFLDVFNLIGSINKDPYVIPPMGTLPSRSLKLDSIEAQEQFENNLLYWKVTYAWSLSMKPTEDWNADIDPIENKFTGTWHPQEVLDQGFYQLNNKNELVLIRDKWGQAKPNPTLLNGAGKELAKNATPVFIDFRFYEEKEWGIIP